VAVSQDPVGKRSGCVSVSCAKAECLCLMILMGERSVSASVTRGEVDGPDLQLGGVGGGRLCLVPHLTLLHLRDLCHFA